VSDVVRVDPERLRDYSAVTLPAVDAAHDPLAAYRLRLRSYLDAPSDLPSNAVDLSPVVAGMLDTLERLDAVPQRLATVMEELDRRGGAILEARADVVSARLDGDDPDLFDRIRAVAEDLAELLGRITPFDEWVTQVPEAVELVVEEITTTLRRTTIVVDEFLDAAWRRTLVTIDEIEATVRRLTVRFDLDWVRRSAPWLRKLGFVGDALAGGLAGLEQWDQDQGRTDLTSTERVLRIGTDVVARGGLQAIIGYGTAGAAGAAVVAAPFTLGGSLVVGGLVIAGGVVVGEVLDAAAAPALDALYETELFGDVADGIDGLGRGLRDGWDAATDWAGQRADDIGGVLDAGRDLAADGLQGLGDRVSDLRSGISDLGGDLVGAMPWNG
jgi:hypothetical protein